MKHRRYSLTIVMLFVVQMALGQMALAQTEVPDGFESLFNGKDLEGWTTDGPEKPAQWRVENGELTGELGAADLRSDRQLINCHLIIELRQRKDDEWRSAHAFRVGGKFSVREGGKLIDLKTQNEHLKQNLPFLESGAIRLPAPFNEGQQIYIRKVLIRELEPEEANQILADHDSEGFEKVFNSTDFEGWDGPIDQYEVVDGVLRCKPNSGGTIFTKKQYSDFTVQVRIQTSAGRQQRARDPLPRKRRYGLRWNV